MPDIRNWLERHGLGRYGQVFAENDVDLDVLPELSEAELEELGVSLGHRKKLRKALLERDEEGGESGSVPLPVIAQSGDPERRQLTVMFCDLVGSTALSGAMDAEDYRDLLGAYQTAAATVIRDHQGYIARYMGDGLLIYFGYPTAQENDAERAARAGLALVEAVRALDRSFPLEVRVGIATGPVVVGDIVGDGASEEAAVLGETPNLAARLQGAAAPSTVLLSRATRQLLRGRVETKALAPVELKGFSRAIVPYLAVRSLPLYEVSEALRDSTPLVGRDVEMALLERAWKHAMTSEGQAVLLTGEAGVGKSRLLRVFQHSTDEHQRTTLQWYCSPYHQTTANYPAIDHLKRSISLDARDADQGLTSLASMVDNLGLDREQLVPPLALLLSIPPTDRYAPPQESPEELRRQVLSAQVRLLLAAAERAPVLLTVEDLHWADPTTLDVLAEMIAAIRTARVLVLLTARTEFSPPWTEQVHATSYRLRALSHQETVTLIGGITQENSLSPDIIDQIAARTDGVPLFIEELTKSVLASGGNEAVPASLQDSLMARLDLLGATKELAQIASVIGREFSLDEVCAIAERSRETVVAGLQALTDARVVHRKAGYGRDVFEFTHALVRDAAYDSLLRSSRKRIHGAMARALQRDFPGRAQTEPELMAHHLSCAGAVADAISCFEKAGTRAARRSANLEAVGLFTRGLELIETLPSSRDRDELELEFRLALGPVLMSVEGYTSESLFETFTRARRLCEDLGDTERLTAALYGQWMFYQSRPDITAAVSTAEQLLTLATSDAAILLGHRMLGLSLAAKGEVREGVEHLQETVRRYRAESDAPLAYQNGTDARVAALGLSAWLSWILGLPDRGAEQGREALRYARELNHSHSIAFALNQNMMLAALVRDAEGVKAHASTLLRFCEEHHIPVFHKQAVFFDAFASCDVAGNELEALARMRQAIADLQARGFRMFTPWLLALAAQAHGRLGRLDEALALADEALMLMEETEERVWEAEIHRVKGEVLRSSGRRDAEEEAERALRRSLEVARGQGARSWMLRTAMDLARLRCRRGEKLKALESLLDALEGFEEGFGTGDLVEAKVIIGELV